MPVASWENNEMGQYDLPPRDAMRAPPVAGGDEPNPVAGQQFAQASGFQLRPIGGGLVQLINPRTGQVLYTGSAAGAANAQAGNAGVRRIID
jgi:hypothetical protein